MRNYCLCQCFPLQTKRKRYYEMVNSSTQKRGFVFADTNKAASQSQLRCLRTLHSTMPTELINRIRWTPAVTPVRVMKLWHRCGRRGLVCCNGECQLPFRRKIPYLWCFFLSILHQYGSHYDTNAGKDRLKIVHCKQQRFGRIDHKLILRDIFI